jgi:DNA-binding response OmpR family regulator
MNESQKILVADDEPVGRQLLEAILYPEGYEIIFAKDGDEALNSIIRNQPDLVLLDVMMPKMDGFEVCKKVRRNPETAHIPIFLITALDDRDSKIKGIDSGADDYISKPFDRIEILGKIKNRTALIQYREEHEIAERQKSKHSGEFFFNENLIQYLSDLNTESSLQNKKSNVEIYNTLPLNKSRHSLLICENEHGTYYCLFSNLFQQLNKILANCIISSLIKLNCDNSVNSPVDLLKKIIDQLKKFEEQYQITDLYGNLDSIIIVLVERKSGIIYASGLRQIIYYLDKVHTKDENNVSLKWNAVRLPNKMNFEIKECEGIFLLSSDIYDFKDQQEIISILNMNFISGVHQDFSNLVSETFGLSGDHIMIKLSI